jgi:hypothetical protein
MTALPGVIAASRRRAGAAAVILGNNIKGSGTRPFGSGRLEVSQFTLAGSGTLRELHGWFNGGGGSSTVRLLIYDDDGGSGLPGTRLAYTAAYTVSGSSDMELSEAGFAVALTAGNYWIGWISSAVSSGIAYGDTGTNQSLTAASFTPPPDPFGVGSAGTRKHSCWAVLT